MVGGRDNLRDVPDGRQPIPLPKSGKGHDVVSIAASKTGTESVRVIRCDQIPQSI